MMKVKTQRCLCLGYQHRFTETTYLQSLTAMVVMASEHAHHPNPAAYIGPPEYDPRLCHASTVATRVFLSPQEGDLNPLRQGRVRHEGVMPSLGTRYYKDV
jgi:hypothetical protein